MTDRVLSTGRAREAVQQLQKIVSGDLQAQIDALTRAGGTLCEPEAWDGQLAARFRGDWPQQQQALMRAKQTLEQLQQQAQQINQNIMQAGGNS
jgi:uncharacterized protein YukE